MRNCLPSYCSASQQPTLECDYFLIAGLALALERFATMSRARGTGDPAYWG